MEGATVHTSPFKGLSVETLDALYQLRQQVFVVEQKCPYQDTDGADSGAIHMWITVPSSSLQKDASSPKEDDGASPLILIDGGASALVGVARMFRPSVKHEGAALGRIACHRAVRGTGLGKHLVSSLISKARELWSEGGAGLLIYASAQVYLQRFYEGFGFVTTGDAYLEDDIPHIDMVLAPPPACS